MVSPLSQEQKYYIITVDHYLNKFTIKEREDSVILGIALQTIVKNSELLLPKKQETLRKEIAVFVERIVTAPQTHLQPETYQAYKKIVLERIGIKIAEIEKEIGPLENFTAKFLDMTTQENIPGVLSLRLRMIQLKEKIVQQKISSIEGALILQDLWQQYREVVNQANIQRYVDRVRLGLNFDNL